LDAVKKWKKRKSANGTNGIEEDDGSFEKMLESGGNNKRKLDDNDKSHDSKRPRVNHKRESKDKKFGYGGKKKYAKSNTRESTNDHSSFSRARNNEGVGKRQNRAAGGKGAKKAPKGGRRPGKSQRTKQRGGRK